MRRFDWVWVRAALGTVGLATALFLGCGADATESAGTAAADTAGADAAAGQDAAVNADVAAAPDAAEAVDGTGAGTDAGTATECVSAGDCPELVTPPCRVVACVAGACGTEPVVVGAACVPTDGPCTEGGACGVDGACVATEKGCDDGDPCTDDTCADPGCAHTPIADCGTECQSAADCLPADVGPCKTVECKAGACEEVQAFDGTDCTSAILTNECVAAGVCRKGQCEEVSTDCDDGIECTDDSCKFGEGCVHVEQDLLCSIPDCKDVADCVGKVVLSGPCKVAKCVLGKCLAGGGPDGNACELEAWADNPCIEAGVCTSGSCVPNQKNCDDGLLCTADACDPAIGSCVHTATDASCTESCDAGPCPEGFYCDDGLIPGFGDKLCLPLKEDGVSCKGDAQCQSAHCGGCLNGATVQAGWCYSPASKAVGQPCKADDECGSETCSAACPLKLTGTCECQTASDCPDGEVCDAGLFGSLCVAQPNALALGEACQGNLDCLSGQCEGGACVCAVGADCGPDQWCKALPAIANSCEPVVPECGGCALDVQCGDGAICLAIGLPLGTPKCVVESSKALGEACCKNAQCEAGSCKSGVCAE